MRILSRQDIEGIAGRVCRAYWKKPIAKKEAWRIVPEILLTEVLGLSIDYRHLSRSRLLLGMTCFSPIGVEVFDSPTEDFFLLDGKNVLIEQDLQLPTAIPGRRNFTIMHEGCHHIFHILFPSDYEDKMNHREVLVYREIENGASSDYWEEWQADTLASAILMPKELLRLNMIRCGISGGIPILDPVFQKDEYDRFVKLSKLMGVSKQALSIRLRHLGLIGIDQRYHPRKAIDIIREEDEDE